MSHTYISDLVHCVFSTKLRRDLISTKIQPDLWAFVGGIARKNEFKALTVLGLRLYVADRVILLRNPDGESAVPFLPREPARVCLVHPMRGASF